MLPYCPGEKLNFHSQAHPSGQQWILFKNKENEKPLVFNRRKMVAHYFPLFPVIKIKSGVFLIPELGWLLSPWDCLSRYGLQENLSSTPISAEVTGISKADEGGGRGNS